MTEPLDKRPYPVSDEPLTPREEFESQFGRVTDELWQGLKEFTEHNYDISDWLRGILGYRNMKTGDVFHPHEIEIIHK
jgi:hypothetical protein